MSKRNKPFSNYDPIHRVSDKKLEATELAKMIVSFMSGHNLVVADRVFLGRLKDALEKQRNISSKVLRSTQRRFQQMKEKYECAR